MNLKFMSAEEAYAVDNLMPGNQAFGVGSRLKAVMDAYGSIGNVFYLDPTHGSDLGSGALGDPVKTLAQGYALLRDGFNDCLVYIPGATGLTLATGFTWAKSYAHFVGASTPVPYSPRSRIFLLSTAASKTFLFKNTGTGNVFMNLLFFMGVADATASYAFWNTGKRCWFKSCHFAGVGDATMDVAGAGSLLCDASEENLYESCVIGNDTITKGADSRELVFSNVSTRETFKDCRIESFISAAGHALVKVSDGTAIDRIISFQNCHFIASSVNRATALTSVFDIPVISQGMIDLDSRCHVSSWGAAASWDSNARGAISSAMVAPAATGGGGISTHK